MNRYGCRALAAMVICLLAAPLGCSMGSLVWVETTEDMQLDAAGLKTLAVRSHNGKVSYTGRAGGEGSILVKITKKAGGATQADAEEALASLEVYSEADGGEGRVINHRWKGIRKVNWNSQVDYEIDGPASLGLNVGIHNGAVKVRGLKAALQVSCQNGQIDTESAGAELRAESHNGQVKVAYEGPRVHATSHNGQVVADLSKCAAVGGKIGTHNGPVKLTLGQETSTDLTCVTHNGSVKVDAGMKVSSASRARVTAQLGGGGQPLNVTTHNGSVLVTAE